MPRERKKSYRKFGRETFAALTLMLFSLPALLFSIFLTVLKLRTSYRCDGFMHNVCSSGCDVALADRWAVVLGVPISVYGTAFYAVVLGLAVIIGLWPFTFTPTARLPVLVLGVAGLGSSLLLGGYAWFGLGVWCIYCSVLYVANFGIFLSATLLNAEGLLRGLRNGLRRIDLLSGTICWAVLSAFIACVLVQKRLYSHAAADALRERHQHTSLSCEQEDLRALPQTAFELPSEGPPEVIVALFFDLACTHCRREAEFWRTYQQEHRDFLQVEFFHLSADPACGPLDSSPLRQNESCSGALALECFNALAGGDPFVNLERLFALQDQPSPYFSVQNREALAREHGVNGLTECMNAPDTFQRISQHIDFGVRMKLTAPPSALIIPARNGKPFGSALRLRGGAKSKDYIDAKIRESRARSRGHE
ncbi:hypothetical protein OV203_27600 [Nannocystis sp. ILAH1]|nr:vitamin K epoxide reductase family protein [Nannocystis sp. ILAH1]MCY0990941.1 hypothetical protein [Nannocystis sp. ILAH1]